MVKGVLLINLGSPDSPSVKDVKKYLSEFLNDSFVMDINPVWRFFLVNFIIIPFRAPKSARLYKQIWTKKGSPLIMHSNRQKKLLQQSLGSDFAVELGMRYQNPSIENAFKNLLKKKVSTITVIPLYPQYAYSSTVSTIAEIKRLMKKYSFHQVKLIEKFYDEEKFFEAWADLAKKYNLNEYQHFLFSYHGLPEKQLKRIYPEHCRINNECCSATSENNKLCYRAACFHTTRELVRRLNIPEGKYTTAFQSRLNNRWLQPFSDEVVMQKAKEGIKKMLVFSPAFVSDCLETLYEIEIKYAGLFKKHGGEKLQLVESLNENEKWMDLLRELSVNKSLCLPEKNFW